jgi:carbamate kinase
MRIVVALGGNALLRREEPMTLEVQRRNVREAADALAPLAARHELVITHGNGPQVGLLALQAEACAAANPYTLDVLGAESEGMIGYLILQELGNVLPRDRRCAGLLTRIEVDAGDAAFSSPTKPIGPVYSEDEARRLAQQRAWHIGRDGAGWRRVVASPRPLRILEIDVIELLLEAGVIVICAGGGGIPIVSREDGSHAGVEAVIDKDLAASVLARALKADAMLLLTDVDGVYADWRSPEARLLRRVAPVELQALHFEPGTMAPKVTAACEFVSHSGGIAGIGALSDAQAILDGNAGTHVAAEPARGASA